MTDPVALHSQSVRHAFPLLHPAQAQKEFTVNEAVARLDALVHPGVIGLADIPPTQPGAGDAYLIGNTPEGEWSGMPNAIAVWQGDQWLIQPPVTGMSIYREDLGQMAHFRDVWRVAAMPAPIEGGTVKDNEARAAIEALVAILQKAGILPG